MKHWITILILILLGTTASATCQTFHDYSVNISIPVQQDYIIDFGATLIGDTTCYSIGGLADDAIYRNIYDECYFNGQNPTNYRVNIVNGTTFYNISRIENTPNLYVQIVSICIGTCTLPYIEIDLNGTGLTNDLQQVVKPTGVATLNIPQSSWEQHYLREWTFKDETTDILWNFTTDPANMTVYCDTSSTFTVNMTAAAPDGGPIVYQTKERPRYSVKVDDLSPRVRQDSDTQLQSNYYLTNQSNTTAEYIFTLQDYTGSNCYRSTMKISKSINDTVGLIDVQRFSQDNLIKSFLINLTNYGFTVECADLKRNIGSILLDDSDLERNIIISTPEFSGYNENWDNLTITLNTDFDSSAINCILKHPTTIDSYFRVYNWSNNVKTLDSSQTESGTNISFTYTSPNTDVTYWVECGATATNLNSGIERLINIRNATANHGFTAFDIQGPDKILGLSRNFIFSIAGAVLAVILISLGSGITYTLYTIVSMMFGILMWYVGWLPNPYGFYITLLFLAIMLHIIRRRKGGEI